MNWDSISFGEAVKMSSGKTPSKSNLAFWNGNIPWITATSMDKLFVDRSPEQLTELALTNGGAKYIPKGTPLLLVRGSILHKRIPISVPKVDVTINQDVKALNLITDKISNDYFLAWLLASEQKLLEKVEFTGIGAGKLDTDILNSLDIPVPPDNVQKWIGDFVFNLNNKIETNSVLNFKLESLLICLFEEWILKGEIFSENESMEFRETELGEIPKNWTIKHLDEIATLDTSSIKPEKFPNDEFLHFSIPSFDHNNLPSVEQGKEIKSGKYLVNKNAILVSKLNPRFKRIWYPDTFNCENRKSICSTEFMQFVPNDGKLRSFIWGVVNSDYFQSAVFRTVTGTTGSRQRAQPKEVSKVKIIIPDARSVSAFCDYADKVLKMIQLNFNENNKLLDLRNKLLPELISGDLTVPTEGPPHDN